MSTKKISDKDLELAFDTSVNDNQILARMLLVSGLLDETSLNAAMRLVFLVKSNLLDQDKAAEVFEYAIKNKLAADEALKKLNIQPKSQ